MAPLEADLRRGLAQAEAELLQLEQQHLDLILDAVADAVELWADKGPEVVANKWNGWKPPLDDPQKPMRKPSSEAETSPRNEAEPARSGEPATAAVAA